MNIKSRFTLFLIGFILFVIILIAGISIYFLDQSFELFLKSENRAFIAITANRILLKALVSYGIMIILIIAVSIPMGLFLSKVISKPYLRLFQNLNDIAQNRLKLNNQLDLNDNERTIMEKYINLLVTDQEKLRDYEKITAWKDGARLFMHEIKNPLTPLKLTAQSLRSQKMKDKKHDEEIQRILTSITDIEKILTYFKKLVNIEFSRKETFDVKSFLTEFFNTAKEDKPDFMIHESFYSPIISILSEKTLLRMVFNNLIKKGLEANVKGFMVSVIEKEDRIQTQFVTKDRSIENPHRSFDWVIQIRGREEGLAFSYVS